MHAEQAELAEFQGQVADGDLAAFVPVRHVRADPVVGDPAYERADVALLVGEQGVEVEEVERGDGHAADVSRRQRTRTRA
ncbi:hypothetical protein KRM28CT15_08540 [Krasilnikovia sp. M28-CT-15]